MKVFKYADVPNFGDELNDYLWPHYFADFINRKDNILMMGIGTVLGFDTDHDGTVIVCGSGCGYSSNIGHVKNWKIFFVRGPATAEVLNLPAEIAITDPAILTPDIFPPAPKGNDVIFVPHWETSKNPLWRRACETAGIKYVDPLGDIHDVMKAISSAKLVVAEAMHAAIIADAYRVPWLAVSTSVRINEFKWQDWAASLNTKVEFHHFAALGASNKLFNLTAKRGANLVKKERKNGEHTLSLSPLKKIYKLIIPQKFRNGRDFDLLWPLAVRIDHCQNFLADKGFYKSGLASAVCDFKTLALKNGHLSNPDISNQRRQDMLNKFDEVRQFLSGSNT